MGRASISIAITSNFNSRGIDAAIKKAEQLAASAVHFQGKFGKAAVDMGTSMGQAGARLVAMGKSVADLGDKMTRSITVPMGLAVAASVAAAAKIDTAWYNVRKTVDMTEEGYAQLREGAMALSEVQPVSAETILNIEALGGQLGISNDKLQEFAQIVSGLDISTNLNSEEAATQLAQFRNVVQMSEDDMDNFASTVVDLGNHTATTEADIMQLALRFASAGHVAGMSNQDILGLSAALAGLGMKADAGGSALSQVINKISLDVAKGGEDVQKWADLVGEAPEKFAEAWRTAPTDQFVKVLQAIAQDGADANEILSDLGITQIRQSDAMRRLASSGDLVTDSIKRANQAWQENTALQREVDNRNESLQARWDTLVNRFTNDLARIGQPIAELGLNALEGFEPVIQGVTDITVAFANADPVVQRFAFNLAGLAMAAGPVLSVTGRLMQAVGNMGIRVGRVSQQWGVYQEALKTTDISMLNTLSHNQSMAASFGASRNEIVKAAGGIDRYNLAYEKTTKAIRDRIEAEDRQIAYQEAFNDAVENGNKTESEAAIIAEKAANSNKRKAETTKKVKAEIEALNKTTDKSNVNTKLNTAAITDQEVAAAKATRTFGKMGDALKGALIGFGASAAIGLAVSGITWLITSMQEAAERADLLDKATNGLRASLTATGTAAEESGNAHRNLLGAIGETHETVTRAIENQAQLGEAFAEVDKKAAAEMGTIDRNAEIIEKYANKGSIGAAQLSLLKTAIENVNQACGTQYSVLEDGTVVIEGETGAIQVNTEEILKNIDARKRQIQLEATQSKYQAAYENLIEQTYARAEAVDRLSKAQERLNELDEKWRKGGLNDEETMERVALKSEVPKLQKEVEELSKTFDEAANAEQYWANAMESYGEKVSQLSLDMQGLIDPASEFAAAFAAAGSDVVQFAAACEHAGINFDFLNSLTTTEIQHMAEVFDGSTASIIRGLEELGKNEALENIGNNWRASIDSASQQLADGITSAHDVSLAELAALANDLGIQGEEAMQRFLTGIQAGLDSGLNIDQAAKLAEKIAKDFEGELTPEQAQEIARTFLENLGHGLTEGEAIANAIQQLKNSLNQVDFTAEGQHAKTTWLSGFNMGGGSGGGGVNMLDPFAQGLYSELDTINNVVNEKGEYTGEQIPYKTAEGIQSSQGVAEGAALSFMDVVMAGLFGGVPQAQQAGAETGQGYADSVSGQGGTAEYAAAQTLGRLLMIWLLGIESARQAGLKTGMAYGEGTSTGFVNAATAAQATVQAIVSLLQSGVGPATAAGQATGTGYGQNVSQGLSNAATFAQAAIASIVAILQSGVGPATAAGQATGTGYGRTLSQLLLNAVTFTQTAVNQIVAALRRGIQPATQAGRDTGNGYGRALGDSAIKAVELARQISMSTGSAFGAGASQASAAGSSLGRAFASAVWSSGGQAVSYARSIRDSVKSIFNDIPTANIKVNVERTVTTKTVPAGGGAVRAALPSAVPVMPVPATAGLDRAVYVAESAVNRIASSGGGSVAAGVGATVKATIRNAAGSAGGVDYDAMYRVMESAVTNAIRKTGGLSPVVQLDGKTVSRQLARHMDYELGRLDRMRG